ncbi:DUF1905 domain-containing protein [Fulvivirga sp. M361]|uniref:DUF1905 domain-containing protein n=1 Tax=Fulvivirga sp. M361 TaxID=2594266 RepID=UPI0011798AAE|nr:DUF1905 domain-containing protein [Fulvivirga sp. M361]TRX48060.1 DUF1905 domain-containing protein [Fulvivirga sp. M361]
MQHKFQAKIYKVGINWCVDVPAEITHQMTSEKGHIKIKGTINDFRFAKNLVPVKNKPYRLFVNSIMMKAGKTALDQTASFNIEVDTHKDIKEYPMPALLREKLEKENLRDDFNSLTGSRKKDILKYLSYIKKEETLLKNIDKLIRQIKNKEKNVRIP